MRELVRKTQDAQQLSIAIASDPNQIYEADEIELMTPVFVAAREGNLTAVKLLAERENGAAFLSQVAGQKGVGDILFWSQKHEPLLLYLKDLFTSNAKIAQANPDITLAHIHAALGDEEYFRNNAQELIKPNRLGITPAFYAKICGHKKLTELVESSDNEEIKKLQRSLKIYFGAVEERVYSSFTKSHWRTKALFIFELAEMFSQEKNFSRANLYWDASRIIENLRPASIWETRYHLRCQARLGKISQPQIESLPREIQFRDVMIIIEGCRSSDEKTRVIEKYDHICIFKPNVVSGTALRTTVIDNATDPDLRLLSVLNHFRLPRIDLLRVIKNKTDDDYRVIASLEIHGAQKYTALNSISEKNDADYRALASLAKHAIGDQIANEINFLEQIRDKKEKDCYLLGNLYQSKNRTQDYNKAIFYLKKYIEICERLRARGFNFGLSEQEFLNAYFQLGQIYLIVLKNKQEAYDTFEKIGRQYLWRHYCNISLPSLRNLVILYLELKQPEKIIQILTVLVDRKLAATEDCLLKIFVCYYRGQAHLANNDNIKANANFDWAYNAVFELPSDRRCVNAAIDLIFSVGRDLPFDVKKWSKLIDFMSSSPLFLTKVKTHFAELFYQAGDETQDGIGSIIKNKVFSKISVEPFDVFARINLDADCESMWLDKNIRDKASVSLYANALLYPKELDFDQVVKLCNEAELQHYLKLALNPARRSVFGNRVFHFLINVVEHEVPKKSNQSIAQMLVYCGLFLHGKKEFEKVASFILKAMETYPDEAFQCLRSELGLPALQFLIDKVALTFQKKSEDRQSSNESIANFLIYSAFYLYEKNDLEKFGRFILKAMESCPDEASQCLIKMRLSNQKYLAFADRAFESVLSTINSESFLKYLSSRTEDEITDKDELLVICKSIIFFIRDNPNSVFLEKVSPFLDKIKNWVEPLEKMKAEQNFAEASAPSDEPTTSAPELADLENKESELKDKEQNFSSSPENSIFTASPTVMARSVSDDPGSESGDREDNSAQALLEKEPTETQKPCAAQRASSAVAPKCETEREQQLSVEVAELIAYKAEMQSEIEKLRQQVEQLQQKLADASITDNTAIQRENRQLRQELSRKNEKLEQTNAANLNLHTRLFNQKYPTKESSGHKRNPSDPTP